MQTHLWCTRCNKMMEIDLQLKKMRGRAKLAQLISVCPKCHTTLHSQTARLETAEATLKEFKEAKAAAQPEGEESKTEEASPEKGAEDECP